MEGDRFLGKREGPGTESTKFRPTKFPKTIRVLELKPTEPSMKGLGGCFKMIDEGDRMTIVAVGKIFDFEKIVWMAGDGFKSEMKVENRKYVVYTPPCSATFLKKELEELTFKQVRYKLKMVPVDTYCAALANAGIRCEEQRLALQESFLHEDDDDECDEDEDDDDECDDEEDAGDEAEAEFGNPETDEEDAGDEAGAEMADPKVPTIDTAAASAAITAAAGAITAVVDDDECDEDEVDDDECDDDEDDDDDECDDEEDAGDEAEAEFGNPETTAPSEQAGRI